MNFVFGYAGIPADVYDKIYVKRNTLTEKNSIFEGVPLKNKYKTLQPSCANSLLNKFKEHLIKNRGKNSDIGFAVIYVRKNTPEDDVFEKAFFPTTLVIPIDWELSGNSPNKINASVNELFLLLFKATIRARSIIKALRTEVVERANRTPLLLPIKNFSSKTLREWMSDLQLSLINLNDLSIADATVKLAAKNFESKYPLKKVESSKAHQPCFFDDKEVEFHSPGKALHGLPNSIDDHSAQCILGGFIRLGAPFNPAFHYDCRKGETHNLKGSFYSCHDIDAKLREGKPHINIAPNDFIRI